MGAIGPANAQGRENGAGTTGSCWAWKCSTRFEGYLINTAAEGRQFVRDVGAGNVGVMLDTFHMNIEEDSLVSAIHTAGDMLCHLHVRRSQP